MDKDELARALSPEVLSTLSNVKIKGLMGMATFTDNQSQIEKEFTFLKNLFDTYKNTHGLDTLSMGMSGDYELAIKTGSTMVRIGSSIFGHR